MSRTTPIRPGNDRAGRSPRAGGTVWRSLAGRRDGEDRLRRLAGVILLDGTVRRSPFAEAIDRSLLDLPLAPDLCLMDVWRIHVQQLSSALGINAVRCRIMVGRTTRPPALRHQDPDVQMSVEADPSDLRGTGGVLRDLAEEYDAHDMLLVANAAQLLVEPLHQLALDAAERGGDVTVIANEDGSPASVALLSCRALRHLPTIGFVDLKEQGLPLMATCFDVNILRRTPAAGLPIRTPADYLAAVRAHHRMSLGAVPHDPPFSERWRRCFSLPERGAVVAPDAALHDSVVLRGARVEAGATVANSIVCGGAVVRRGQSVQRQLLGPVVRVPIHPEAR